MFEMMSDAELNDALRSSQERLRQVLNEQHRRGVSTGGGELSTIGGVARHAAVNALRADRKSVLAFAAIVVIMVGVGMVNAWKALVGL